MTSTSQDPPDDQPDDPPNDLPADLPADLPRRYVVRESSHRIHNALVPEKLARLGEALRLSPSDRVLDLASGSGEMLCTWAHAHGIGGLGVDLSSDFTAAARARALELGVADRVSFMHGDASSYVADGPPYDVASCLGATWIGGGVAGTLDLLERSLRPGGLVLVGEPWWREGPPSDDVARACHASSVEEWTTLPDLVASFAPLGWDVVQLVLSDADDWDAYHGAQWLSTRRWLDAHPHDDLAPELRAWLDRAPLDHVTHVRRYLGWGVFVLMRR